MSQSKPAVRMNDHDDLDGPQTTSELLKVEFEGVMVALYGSMRRFAQPAAQCGVSEVAELLDMPAGSAAMLRNQFGPTVYDQAPTLYRFLQVLQALESREAAAAVAALADCVVVPRSIKAAAVKAPRALSNALAQVGPRAAAAVKPHADIAHAKGQLTAAQREKAIADLLDLQAYIAHVTDRLRKP